MKKVILLTTIIFIRICVSGQIPERPVTMLSPNASGLGEYGEVSVSLFTGIPQISVPLYEINSDEINIPLSMSYHAGGVRPDQHPGWTGLGWTLNSGGCISRIMNDQPDDLHMQTVAYAANAGYYYNYSVLDFNKWDTTAGLTSIITNQAKWRRDTEPDKFIFNFLDYHGYFYLNEKREWKVNCDRPVKVLFDGQFIEVPFSAEGTLAESLGIAYSTCFKGFTIIGEDGTKYVFGSDNNTIEYSAGFATQGEETWCANTWFLKKIITTKGREINFIYERGKFISQLYLSVYETIEYRTFSSGNWSSPKPACASSGTEQLSDYYDGQIISPVYLTKIEFSNGYIEFDREISNELTYTYEDVYLKIWNAHDSYYFLPILRNDGFDDFPPKCFEKLKWYKLKKITVYNNNNKKIKNVSFTYNDSPTERLMLKSIVESNGYLKGRQHKFEYYNQDMLPDYLSNRTDHWGYYNNIEAPIDDKTNYYSRREPNPDVALYGTLNKIVYPTGGYTKFIFEPHQYRKQLTEDRSQCTNEGVNKYAGGLRIKKIINSSTGNENDEKSVKEYYYVDNYEYQGDKANISTGVLGGLVRYGFDDYTVNSYHDKNKVRTRMSIFSSQSVLPMCSNSQGSHIGYTTVFEKEADGSISKNIFSNFDNRYYDDPCEAIIQESHTIYEPYSSKEQDRGLLLSRYEYDSNKMLKREIQNEYEKDETGVDFVRCAKAISKPVCWESAVQYHEGVAYKFYFYNNRISKETIWEYENIIYPKKTVKTYSYNSNKMISKIVVNHPSSDYLDINAFLYPTDFNTIICKSMTNKNKLSHIVESQKYLINKETLDSIPVSKIKYNYIYVDGNIELPGTIEKSEKGQPYEKRAEYKYDKNGNIIYVENDMADHTIYLWGYNNQYIVAEIKNATLEEVSSIIGDIELFSSARNPVFSKLDRIRMLLPDAYVTTYRYVSLIGAVAKTDMAGKTTYFSYDALGRLVDIKDNDGNIIEHNEYNYQE